MMMRLPLLVLPPDESALLPGERRRFFLEDERALTALRLARRSGGELAILAFDPAQRGLYGGDEELTPDALLPLATHARVLRCRIEGDSAFFVLRGQRRVWVRPHEHGGCCQHDDPFHDGTEVELEPHEVLFDAEAPDAWEGLRQDLEALDLWPLHRQVGSLERSIDRLATWLCLPPWTKGALLASADLAGRIRLLAAHARELAAPGSSFHRLPLGLPYESEEEHHEDRVRLFDFRARAESSDLPTSEGEKAWVEAQALRQRKRGARLCVRALRAKLDARLRASEEAGRIPSLEKLRREHALREAEVEALLLAGLAENDRFADRLRLAARLLPPAELPLPAWIEALQRGVFSAG